MATFKGFFQGLQPLGIGVVLLFGGGIIFALTHRPQPQILPIGAKLLTPRQEITLEVAQTPQQLALGLMHRSSLNPNQGMLFEIRPPQIVSFWMRGVQIPLDILFVRSGRVVSIAANALPCRASPCPRYFSQFPVDSVIELNAGQAKRLGLGVGSPLRIKPVLGNRRGPAIAPEQD